MRRFAPLTVALILAAAGGLVGLMSVAAAQPAPPITASDSGPNYQGLWWNAPANSESGWGINFAHQGDTIFASWFTYDVSGKGWWLVMTASKISPDVYGGTLYRTTGPPFNAVPFDPAKMVPVPVGSGTLTFSGPDNGTFSYAVDGVSQTKAIVRQVFGPLPTCAWSAQPDLAGATNYQDLWWVANGAESGWGVNLTHQGDIIFATWFTYDFDGSVLWLAATVTKGGNRVYTGTLYRTTGPTFNAQPFDPGRVTATPVGRLTITFADGNTAAFAYTLYGVTQIKTITREVFFPPAGTVCSSPVRVPTSVTVATPTPSPWVGETVLLTATVRDQFGYVIEGVTPTWSSSNPGVATISANGALQGSAAGPVVMTASIGNVFESVSVTITPKPRISVSVGSTKEVVFDYTTDHCSDLDLPDQPARFVRAEDGSLVLVATDAPRNYLSRGANFNSLKRDCSQPALVSADRTTPESYENQEWLWVVYREGTRWHALIHNEYHDPFAGNCKPGDTSPANWCWYNSITHAVSTDGGRSFTKSLAPAHVVAPPPDSWVPPPPGTSPRYCCFVEGYKNPTNIVRAGDGYYYALFSAVWDKFDEKQGNCVMRTGILDDPSSWRAWDGTGFNLAMTSPYVTGTSASLCPSLDTNFGLAHVVYNTYLKRYMGVNQAEITLDGRIVCGFYFALSADLVHWSEPQLLAEAWWNAYCSSDPHGPGVLEPVAVAGPSIVDHADTTTNFEIAGRTPYLYYIRFNDCCLDRDMVRVPLTFTRLD